ncbi:hypothetical protein PR048_029462 [Dryococelus australis]|uniref:Uncharacterized protein n=1 Tax=Dryococelus australis TaxID=614101 RepID=A0ABQ9GDG6_9NEOP|nr:hypothetical protein PR048_029462 [Dryococelus australis]
MKEGSKREIPEKTRGPAASSGTKIRERPCREQNQESHVTAKLKIRSRRETGRHDGLVRFVNIAATHGQSGVFINMGVAALVVGYTRLETWESSSTMQIRDTPTARCLPQSSSVALLCTTVGETKYFASQNRKDTLNPRHVHDKVSTFEINLRKKSQHLPAYFLTGALSDMRPVNMTLATIMHSTRIENKQHRRSAQKVELYLIIPVRVRRAWPTRTSRHRVHVTMKMATKVANLTNMELLSIHRYQLYWASVTQFKLSEHKYVGCIFGAILWTLLRAVCTRRKNGQEIEIQQGFRKVGETINGLHQLILLMDQAIMYLCHVTRKSCEVNASENSCKTLSRRMGAAEAERIARSPPTKANRVQSPTGSPHFRKWKSCLTMPLVGGSSWGSPLPPTQPILVPLHIHFNHPHRLSRPRSLRTISPPLPYPYKVSQQTAFRALYYGPFIVPDTTIQDQTYSSPFSRLEYTYCTPEMIHTHAVPHHVMPLSMASPIPRRVHLWVKIPIRSHIEFRTMMVQPGICPHALPRRFVCLFRASATSATFPASRSPILIRRLSIPGLHDGNWSTISTANKTAFNSPIQLSLLAQHSITALLPTFNFRVIAQSTCLLRSDYQPARDVCRSVTQPHAEDASPHLLTHWYTLSTVNRVRCPATSQHFSLVDTKWALRCSSICNKARGNGKPPLVSPRQVGDERACGPEDRTNYEVDRLSSSAHAPTKHRLDHRQCKLPKVTWSTVINEYKEPHWHPPTLLIEREKKGGRLPPGLINTSECGQVWKQEVEEHLTASTLKKLRYESDLRSQSTNAPFLFCFAVCVCLCRQLGSDSGRESNDSSRLSYEKLRGKKEREAIIASFILVKLSNRFAAGERLGKSNFDVEDEERDLMYKGRSREGGGSCFALLTLQPRGSHLFPKRSLEPAVVYGSVSGNKTTRRYKCLHVPSGRVRYGGHPKRRDPLNLRNTRTHDGSRCWSVRVPSFTSTDGVTVKRVKRFGRLLTAGS